MAEKAEVSRTIIGNYEWNTKNTSIKVLLKIAKVYNVSIDFLIGESELSTFDKDVLKRIEEFKKMDSGTKQYLFFLIDILIQNHKTKQAFI